MLVLREAGSSSNPIIKLIQVRAGLGWYEDGALITSYAANGNSDVWTWTVPTKAKLTISGCGGGGGGGAGYNNGASAGAGGGGGASGIGLQNLIVLVSSGEVIKISLGAFGAAGVAGGAAATDGGNTKIEFTTMLPGEFDSLNGGSIGNLAMIQMDGGGHGISAAAGGTGFGAGGTAAGWIVNPASTTGAQGQVSEVATPAYTRQVSGGGAGANPGGAGGSQALHVGHSLRACGGGAAAGGAAGGGSGGVSLFGIASPGGAGHSAGTTMTVGWGSGGGGGGGNQAGNSDAGNGAAGRAGYVEIIYEVIS